MGAERTKFKSDNKISRSESKEFQRQVREATRYGRAHIREFSREARSFMSNDLRKKNRAVLRSFGETEKSFQRMLKKAGYYRGTLDGVAGKGTQIAYINFEKKSGFWKAGVNDGIVSGKAINYLRKISKSAKLKTKRRKSRGEKVSESFDRTAAEVYNKSRYNLTKRKRIATKLGIKSSSIRAITQALHDYQVANGLDNDGKLGPATLNSLTLAKSIKSVRNKTRRKRSTEITTRSASLKKYLKNPKWSEHLGKLMNRVENLERRPLAIVSNIKARKTLIIKKGRVQEMPFTPGNGTTPRTLRFARNMNIASSPNVDASNKGSSATVLGAVLDFGDTKHVHGVAKNRTWTEGCIGLNTDFIYNTCQQLKSNAVEIRVPWKGWRAKRRGKVNKYGFRSAAGTAKRYRLRQSVPVLTV